MRALSIAATCFIGATRGDKNEEEQIRRFERCEARKHLQQEEDRQQQDLERFQGYFHTEHNYAAKDCHDSPSPSPRKMKCDPLYIPLPQERGTYVARGVNEKKDNYHMSLLSLSYISHIGCQTDHDSVSVEEFLTLRTQIKVLEEENAALKSKIDRQVLSANILENNDQLARFYTGFPSSSSFQAFLTYITPKASRLRSRRSQQKSDGSEVGSSSHRGQLCLLLNIADQLVCVLAKLKLGVPSLDICTRVGVSESTFSCLFST